MPSYRARPVRALRYQPGPGGNCAELAAMLGDDYDPDEHGECYAEEEWVIADLPGVQSIVAPGQWVVEDHAIGSWIVMTDEDFRAVFEAEEGEDG